MSELLEYPETDLPLWKLFDMVRAAAEWRCMTLLCSIHVPTHSQVALANAGVPTTLLLWHFCSWHLT